MPLAATADTWQPRRAVAVPAASEVIVYALIGLFILGVNIEIKGMIPVGGAPIESAFRWLPSLALTATLLAFHRPWEGIPQSWAVNLFVLALLQSSVFSPSTRSMIEFVRDVPVFLTVYAILAGTIDERRFWYTVALALSLISVLSLMTTVAIPSQGWMNYEWGPSQWRLKGITSHAVMLTTMTGLASVLTACLFFQPGSYRWKLLFAVLTVANVVAFDWGGSRGPWLGVLLGLAVLGALAVASVSRVLSGVVLIVLLVLLPATLVGLDIFLHTVRLESVINYALSFHDQRMLTLVERALIWDVARHHVAEAPFFGTGHALGIQVNHYLADADGFYPSVHALFLHYWSESGIFALIGLVAIIYGGYYLNVFLSVGQPLSAFSVIRVATIVFVLGCALFDAPFQPRGVMLPSLAAAAFTLRRSPRRDVTAVPSSGGQRR